VSAVHWYIRHGYLAGDIQPVVLFQVDKLSLSFFICSASWHQRAGVKAIESLVDQYVRMHKVIG